MPSSSRDVTALTSYQSNEAGIVGVDRDGKLYLEGKAIAADALAKALVDHALKSPGTEVVIVADERSLTGAAVHALDAVAKAGLKPRLQTRQPR